MYPPRKCLTIVLDDEETIYFVSVASVAGAVEVYLTVRPSFTSLPFPPYAVGNSCPNPGSSPARLEP